MPKKKKNSEKAGVKDFLFRHWFRLIFLFGILGVLLIPKNQLLDTPLVSTVRKSDLDNFSTSFYPKKTGVEDFPVVSAESFIILDLDSGTELFAKNPDEKLKPASITKLMTALVALDYYQVGQILTVKRLSPEFGESEMGLNIGDRVSVHNLLYGLLVPSGNDAAYTIADNYPGGIENFIYAMNSKANNLGMKNTHYENPSGLDSAAHFSSAKDVASLTTVALRNKLISKIVATYGITLTDITGKKFYEMKNVNKFLDYLSGADGVKTGFTNEAGECLVASVTRSNHRLVSVVLKSNDRFEDSSRLLEWAFRNFTWVDVKKGI